MVIACARDGNGYHDVKPPPLPPPPPVPVQLLISVENSALTAGDFGDIEAAVVGWTKQLVAAKVSFLLYFYRSTENPDGTYDSRPQGALQIANTETDVPGSVHAALQAVRSAPLGKAPLPLQILVQAMGDSHTYIPPSCRYVLVSFASTSVESWVDDGRFDETQGFFRNFFDSALGAGNWRALTVFGTAPVHIAPLFGLADLGNQAGIAEVGQHILDWGDYPVEGSLRWY